MDNKDSYPEVKIIWHDAKMYGVQWIESHGLSDCGIAPTLTVGLLIDENEEAVLVTQSQSEKDRSNLIAIPKGCIKEIYIVKEWERR